MSLNMTIWMSYCNISNQFPFIPSWFLLFGFCSAPVCQQSYLLPLPFYSLSPLHLHWASLYSRVSIATLADMQQVSVSRGTQFSLLPLASQSAPRGSDWLVQPRRLIVFTEMRSRAEWLATTDGAKERKPSRRMKRSFWGILLLMNKLSEWGGGKTLK